MTLRERIAQRLGINLPWSVITVELWLHPGANLIMHVRFYLGV